MRAGVRREHRWAPDSPESRDRMVPLKQLLVPLTVGVGAARHLAWYVAYHVTGEPRRP
jgi:hypothetical protein